MNHQITRALGTSSDFVTQWLGLSELEAAAHSGAGLSPHIIPRKFPINQAPDSSGIAVPKLNR